MKRLLFVPFTAALAAAGSMLAVSPASAAPSVATCRPGVTVASSASISPRVVHAGRTLSVNLSVDNCTLRTQTGVARMLTTLPTSCGTAVGAGSVHFVLIPHSGFGSGGGGQAPTCPGRFVDTWLVTVKGKIVSRASASYVVIK